MISNKIEQLRKEKNVKQTDIAQAIGFTVSGYQKAIQANDFKVSTLEKIAEALEVPVTYFFEDSGDKHFLSEIFLETKSEDAPLQKHFLCEIFYETKNAKEEINALVYKFLYVEYQKFFFKDSEVQILLFETYKKQYNEFLKKLPDNIEYSDFRKCTVFFGAYLDIPGTFVEKFTKMIIRISGNFFTAIKENKSIHWLLKNEIINESFLFTSISEIAGQYHNRNRNNL